MMNAPYCNDHGILLRDLALGKLDDEEALRAEELLDSCEACAAWWSAQFESEAALAVDAAVADAFSTVDLPARRRNARYGWAAAAAALVIGVGAVWQMAPSINTAPARTVAEVAVHAEHASEPGLISRIDFESGTIVVHKAPGVKAEKEPGLISRWDFESGELPNT